MSEEDEERIIAEALAEVLAVELGDFTRNGLAYLEAHARDDEQAMAAILEAANPVALLQAVTLIADQCAITGALLGGASENSSREELLAVRDAVLRHIRQAYERGGVI